MFSEARELNFYSPSSECADIKTEVQRKVNANELPSIVLNNGTNLNEMLINR